MRHLHLFLFLLIGFVPALHAAPQKPNIVFFLVDDLGLGDVGCFGSTFHETPHIDRLCADGMKFTQAYSACTVCSPSRAAILLGKYPGRSNLTDWIAGHGRKNPKLLIPDWNMRMHLEETTLAEALTSGGYRSQFVGKWHLMPNGAEDFEEHFPTSHGFEINIAGREWGQPKGPGKYFPPFGMPNLDDGDRERGDYLTTSLTDEAVKFIEATGGKEDPFFLYFSYYTVHGPIMAPPDLVKKYEAKAKAFEKPHTERVHPAFAAMTELLDDSVGRVRATLEERGLADNTAIVFTSDNGGTSELASAGLRGAKALAYEGGTRVATMVYWPGVTQAGSECAVSIIGNDFYPTLLEMAGLDALPDQHLDGLSLVPLLKGESEAAGSWERDALYWHYPHYHRTNPYGAVRQGDWKLIEFFENGDLELYHLGEDPAERNNRVSTDPEKAAALLKNLKAWRKSVDAQIPTPNPDFDPALGAKAKAKAGARPKLKGKAQPTKPISTPFGDISASSNQAGNSPEKAADGDRSTRWAAVGDAVPQWIQLDLGETKSLAGLEIHFTNKTWIHYQVDVSADGGKQWETVHESKTDHPIQDETIAFEAKGNCLRVTVNDLGSGWVTITELEPKFVGE